MNRLLLISCLFIAVIANAQLLDEGYLQFKNTPASIGTRDSISFSVMDNAKKIPNGSIIRVDWLDENGRLLDYKLIPLADNKVCGVFRNEQISRGPSLLRAYFYENGKPMHTARSIVYIGGKIDAVSIPESLQPVIINAPFKKADKTYSVAYIIREKYRSSGIQYQLINDNGELEIIDGIDRIGDSLLRIKDIDYVGRGAIRFYVNADREFRDYDNFSITSIEPVGSIAWGTDSISKQLMGYITEQLKKEGSLTKRANGASLVTQYTKDGLPEVVVTAVRRSRSEELENRYINNNLFRNVNSTTVNVLDDPSANANMSLLEYVQIKFPMLRLVDGGLQYRNGSIQYFLDEAVFDDLSAINIRDIAMIRFIKASIRGLNSGGGGLAAAVNAATQGSGASARRNVSGIGNTPAPAGNTGTLVIYTKKGDDRELELKKKMVTLPIIGIEYSKCNN
jgi:hypothetical protein